MSGTEIETTPVEEAGRPAPPDAEARLFVALDLPDRVLDEIVVWQTAQLRHLEDDGRGLRAVPAAALHVTLAFLGRRPKADVPMITETLQDIAQGPVEGSLGAEPLPVPRGRPRLLALEVESAAAIGLQATLAARLAALGVYRPERRPFWPHLTVFRVKGRAGWRHLGEGAGGLGSIPPRSGHAFGFVRVALYLSNLRPEGASYARLAANELPQ